MTEDEMVGWHYQLDAHAFEQAPGVGDRQGSLACTVHGIFQGRILELVAISFSITFSSIVVLFIRLKSA